MMLGLSGSCRSSMIKGSFGGFGFGIVGVVFLGLGGKSGDGLDGFGRAKGDGWEVFGADVSEKEVFVTFLLKANGALGDVAAHGLVVIGCTTLDASSTGHCPLEVSAGFPPSLERRFAIRASITNGCE